MCGAGLTRESRKLNSCHLSPTNWVGNVVNLYRLSQHLQKIRCLNYLIANLQESLKLYVPHPCSIYVYISMKI